MNRIDRISALLIQLQSRPVVKASQMADRFGVSLRTIYRDIRSLCEAGVPVCGDAGVGYSLVEGYRLPPLMFTKQEATALLTAEKFVEQLTDPHNSLNFRQAMDKIRAVMRGVDKSYLSGVGDSMMVYRSRRTPGPKLPGLLQTLLGSVNDRLILLIDYTDADGKATRRELEAVGVTYSHPYWYLAAWCHLRNEYRSFRMDRIGSVETTSKPHTREHPPLEIVVGQDDPGCLTEVVVRTSRELARRTADASYFMGLVNEHELPDGCVEQTYMTYSLESMARWALSNADTTTVVSPPEVNERIEQILKNIKP